MIYKDSDLALLRPRRGPPWKGSGHSQSAANLQIKERLIKTKQDTFLYSSKAGTSFLMWLGKYSASFSLLWENYMHQCSGLSKTGSRMVSVDLVAITELYSEKES